MPSFRIPFYCTRVKKQLFTFVSIKRDAFDLVSTLLFFLSCRNEVISRARDEKIKKRNNIFDFYAIGTRIYRHVHNMTVIRARARGFFRRSLSDLEIFVTRHVVARGFRIVRKSEGIINRARLFTFRRADEFEI